MKKTALIINPVKDKDLMISRKVIKKLTSLGFSVCVDEILKNENLSSNNDTRLLYYSDIVPVDTDVILVIGGDGSFIAACAQAVNIDVPILGINLGTVGYLSEVETQELDMLDHLKNGNYQISEKMLLCLCDENDVDVELYLAVNDVVVCHDGPYGLANVRVEDSVGNVINYRADGVIFSTPQGSTAYSFSSGGPIVAHDVDTVLMTPISPHSLFNRSVLFNSSEALMVTNIGEHALNIYMDGICKKTLGINGSCYIKKSLHKVKFLALSKNRMFSNLFKKLNTSEI